MALDGKISVDISYCVPWGYHNEAAWMVSEFFAAGGTDVAVGLIPGESGVLTVVVDGETIFDKKAEGGHPNLDRVKQMKAHIKQKVEALG